MMSVAADAVRERIKRRDTFRRVEITALMDIQGDLDLWSAVYRALGESYHQIDPEPGMELTCSLMLRYLLRCIRENPPSDQVHSGYEAAWELAACLKHWSSKLPQTDSIMRSAARDIASVFASGDERVQDRLLNGTLEHALESAQVRPFFASWADDAVLSEAWRLAMEWAVDHGDPDAGR